MSEDLSERGQVPVDTTRVEAGPDADGAAPAGGDSPKHEDDGALDDELPEDGGALAEAEGAEADAADDRAKTQAAEPKQEEDENEDENEDEEDEDDEEDEEEDEEEEEAEEARGGSRRKKRRLRNQFLDVEAEDDDEEDDLSGDEEGLAGEDGFVQEEADGEEARGAERVYRQLDRRREQERFTEEDAEKLAERYRERYGRMSASKYGQSGASVPQQLLLPSVDDPMIFGINCRQGREREAVKAVLRKQLSLQYNSRPPPVYSAFQRDGFPGRIYVEAATEAAALAAVAGVPNVFASSRVLKVPIREYPDMFRVARTQEAELQPGRYVRVKRGKYAGDLAVVVDLSENGLDARLKIVPRLDYGRQVAVSGQAEKRKRGAERPPARLFSSTEAAQYDARSLMRNGTGNVFVYNGEDYVQGYLHKDFRIAMLETSDVRPTLAEIAQFQDAQDGDIDLASLGESLRSSTAAFAEGERVEVTQGEQTGMQGRVTDVNATDSIVTLKGDREPYLGLTVSVPAAQLRKHFAVGDHVRVVRGNYKDDTGLVVAAAKGRVTLLSDSSQSEITVFARDLRAASDTAVQNQLGAYGLQDLVQLNAQVVGCIVDVERDSVRVLAQDGQVLTLKPESIAMKLRAGGQRSATDAHGREVTVGDTVRELGGEQATGTIVHIYHQYVFMHNRERSENLGVFVNRVSRIATVATKQAREKGLDLSRMNPAAPGGGAGAGAQGRPLQHAPHHRPEGQHRARVRVQGPEGSCARRVRDGGPRRARGQEQGRHRRRAEAAVHVAGHAQARAAARVHEPVRPHGRAARRARRRQAWRWRRPDAGPRVVERRWPHARLGLGRPHAGMELERQHKWRAHACMERERRAHTSMERKRRAHAGLERKRWAHAGLDRARRWAHTGLERSRRRPNAGLECERWRPDAGMECERVPHAGVERAERRLGLGPVGSVPGHGGHARRSADARRRLGRRRGRRAPVRGR